MYERLESADGTLALRLGETLTAEEIDALYAQTAAALEGRERMNYYVDATRWAHIAPDVALHALKQRLLHLGWYNRFRRVAVVTDSAVLRSMVTAMDWVTPIMDVRSFASTESAAALNWCENG